MYPGMGRSHAWKDAPYSVSHAGSCTAHEVKDYGYYGKKEKDVDEES